MKIKKSVLKELVREVLNEQVVEAGVKGMKWGKHKKSEPSSTSGHANQSTKKVSYSQKANDNLANMFTNPQFDVLTSNEGEDWNDNVQKQLYSGDPEQVARAIYDIRDAIDNIPPGEIDNEDIENSLNNIEKELLGRKVSSSEFEP